MISWAPREGTPGARAHWAAIRAKLAAGEQIVERHPPMTLAQQADKQIARLEKEIGEWEAIKQQALSDKRDA